MRHGLLSFVFAAGMLAVGCVPAREPAQAVQIAPPHGDPVPLAVVPPGPVEPAPGSAAPASWCDVAPEVDRRSFTRRPARSMALLAAENQALSRLLEVTPASDPDRPRLLMRLAESFAEMAREEGAPASRARAAEHYALAAEARWSGADEARYYEGLEQQCLGDMDKARRAYFDIVLTHPASSFVPYAYFAFGELFRRDSDDDSSKIELARLSYNKVLEFRGTPLIPLTRARLAALPSTHR